MSIFAVIVVVFIVVTPMVVCHVHDVECQKREEREAVRDIREALENGDDVIVFDDGSYAIRMKGSK